ncbi:hypothetical protein [Sphingopyxis sp. MSC1_008]|jgi:hypothetical protein|uniref:hypothetical protein n=1 Tax=Sphingopyxis sp. MSC1_008 TaxID=2909265 RepID=UPI0020BFF39D|nr:hypothetical protein [Sphingopyxis sp. MSC1_008]
MPITIIIVDLVGLLLAIAGFLLAFRQEDVRRWWAAMRRQTLGAALRPLTNDDPARYVLRIAGVMICAFGIVIALLFTLAHFTLRSSG